MLKLQSAFLTIAALVLAMLGDYAQAAILQLIGLACTLCEKGER